jgi:hypothetical protein
VGVRGNWARKNYAWRDTVYAGIFDVDKVRELLQNFLRAPDSAGMSRTAEIGAGVSNVCIVFS